MDFSADTLAFAAVLDRAAGARLLGVERLVRTLPRLFPHSLQACDLGHRPATGILVLVMRFAAAAFGPADRARLDFWCGRAGVRASALDRLAVSERDAFVSAFERCERRAQDLAPEALLDGSARFFTEIGAPGDRILDERGPVLAIDVGGPGWAGVRQDAATRTLFFPGQLAPAPGDVFTLSLRFPAKDHTLETLVRVLPAGSGAGKSAGNMLGFTVELAPATPPALLEALAALRGPVAAPGDELRRHQRYPTNTPVTVTPLEGEPPFPESGEPAAASAPTSAASAPLAGAAEVPGAEEFPRAEIAYDSDEALAADHVCENISQGGAFIRTTRPSPVGTRVQFSMTLPSGEQLSGPAVVVAVKPTGMGVKFELDAEAAERLAVALAQLSARTRRVLVVDDDELVRRMLSDSFSRRGYEVLTAADGASGLATVVDELLGLDLLVTDLRMPNMDGQAFIRTIREAGGESDLAIVAITGQPESGLEKRLEREGADAVLDKELGPEIIARAADAVLERKRAKRMG